MDSNHGSRLESWQNFYELPTYLIRWRPGHYFDQDYELHEEDIQVGMPFPQIGHGLV
jgi:hypothetical protein